MITIIHQWLLKILSNINELVEHEVTHFFFWGVGHGMGRSLRNTALGNGTSTTVISIYKFAEMIRLLIVLRFRGLQILWIIYANYGYVWIIDTVINLMIHLSVDKFLTSCTTSHKDFTHFYNLC